MQIGHWPNVNNVTETNVIENVYGTFTINKKLRASRPVIVKILAIVYAEMSAYQRKYAKKLKTFFGLRFCFYFLENSKI